MDLDTLGWSTYNNSDDVDTSMVARILAVHRSHLRAATHEKEVNLHLPGQIIETPAVGDWVTVTPEFEDEQGEPAAIIQQVLPRKSVLSRWTQSGEQVFAANVDKVFVVTSANQDFNLNRLQRFLLLIHKGGSEPVVILSKTDLTANSVDLVKEVTDKLNVKVIGTSVLDDSGVEKVLEHMPHGSTSVFVGSSGVGKSSLVNRLLQKEVQITKEIRDDDAKGRHATTSRQMFLVPDHGLIIDTPGVREVQVFGDTEDLDETFPKVSELISHCRFTDCQHGNEPGCAIQEALGSGDLDEKEWNNYLKLQKEVAYAKRKGDKAEMANSKKRWRDINVMMRKRRKFEESD